MDNCIVCGEKIQYCAFSEEFKCFNCGRIKLEKCKICGGEIDPYEDDDVCDWCILKQEKYKLSQEDIDWLEAPLMAEEDWTW